MFKLDNDFLTSLGLGGLPVDEKNKLLQMIYERLEMNVGMRLAEKMTDQQLDEFEAFIDQNDEAGALKWLETNFPNYKDVVAEELEKLKVEVTAAAPQILASHNGAQPQPAIMTEPVMPGVPQPAIQQPSYAPQPQSAPQPFAPPDPLQPLFNPQQPPVNPTPQPLAQPYAPSAPAPVTTTPQTPTFDPTYNYQSAPAPQPAPQMQQPASIPTNSFMPEPSLSPTPQPAPSYQSAPPSQPFDPAQGQPQPFNQTQGGQFTPPPVPPAAPSAGDFTPGQQ